MDKKNKNFHYYFLLSGYCIASLLLLFYSYTQVDLSLTLSRVSLWQTTQKSLQYIGYYQRPISTGIYFLLLLFFYSLYIFTLMAIRRGYITNRHFWMIVLCVTTSLVLSYPAFSYDMFNYMFTAKTVLIYHKNPYLVIPLQFSGVEPWLSFLHWTHLPSAYSPLWILFTLPAYILGFGYFLLIMWNIKLLVGVFYLITIWYIGKIVKKTYPNNMLFSMAFFALNPLVIIESLVSSHNDIVMMAFSMMSVYFMVRKNNWRSFLLETVSVAMKFMTIFLLPLYFLGWRPKIAVLLMTIGFVLVLFQREVLPWYFLWILPFVALNYEAWSIYILSVSLSLGLLLRYAPFIYLGHWNEPAPTWKIWMTIVPVCFGLGVILFKAIPVLLRFATRRGSKAD